MENNTGVDYSGYWSPIVKDGWQCPLCNRVYSPYVDECWYCNNFKYVLEPWIPSYPYVPTYPYNQDYEITCSNTFNEGTYWFIDKNGNITSGDVENETEREILVND